MITSVAVVVPAHNERDTIAACVTALLAARDHAHQHIGDTVEIRVLFVLDSCTDGTEHHIPPDPGIETVTCQLRRVGAARALGAHIALNGSSHAPHHTWLANTDADSRVPPQWLTHQIELGNNGTHLSLGTVDLDLAHTAPDYLRWRRHYIPHDGHPHIHGANLGIRSDTYHELGGWPDSAYHEDVELVRRARAKTHLRITRTGAVPVTTSARHPGRTPAGFAHYMRQLRITPSGDDSWPLTTPG